MTANEIHTCLTRNIAKTPGICKARAIKASSNSASRMTARRMLEDMIRDGEVEVRDADDGRTALYLVRD